MTGVADLGLAPKAPTEVPVDHLDYEYITECNNQKELERILKTLRSGKEGRWEQLETHCENRLRTVAPTSKLLRVQTEILRPGALDDKTKAGMDQDINDWLENMQQTDTQLKNSKNMTASTAHTIRQSGQVYSEDTKTKSNGVSEQLTKKKNAERLSAYDYRAWDKYDPDEEVKKLEDQETVKPKAPKGAPLPRKIPKSSFNPGAYTDPVEKKLAADREKDKGNESFKSGDYQESITYYSNSIAIQPSPATYNNRGLAELRLERYVKAIADFDTVLDLEPDNVKALLRRADAREKVGNIKEAQADLQRSCIVDENNTRAQVLLDEFTKRHSKLLTKGGKRMKIVESESEGEEENKENIMKEQVAAAEPVTAPKVCKKEQPAKPSPPKPAGSKSAPSTPAPTPSIPAPSEPVSKPTPEPAPKAESAPAEEPKNIVEILPLSEKLDKLKKVAGTSFTAGSYGIALDQYTECLTTLDTSLHGNAYTHALLLSNRAACKLKTGACTGCIKDCNESLTLNPRWCKSILRRAIAYETIENYKKAYEDYRMTLVMDSSQVTAQQGVSRVGELLRQKYGAKWREQVTSSSTLPKGPHFVPQGSTPSPSPSVQHSAPKVVKTEPSPAPKETPKPKESPKPAPTSKPAAPTPKPAATPKPTEAPKEAPKTNRMPTKEEQYAKFKDQGNGHVAKQQYREALRCYEKCITLNPALPPAHLNSALCHLKLGNHTGAVKSSSTVLDLEKGNIKALYRRASAYKELTQYANSAKDLKELLKNDSSNKQAEDLLAQIKVLWNNQLRGQQGDIASAMRHEQNPFGSAKPEPKRQPEPKKQPEQPKKQAKKGKKINIVAEDDEPTPSPKAAPKAQPKPKAPEPKVVPKPAPEAPKPQEAPSTVPKSNKDKPWMKKTTTGSLSGLTETTTAFSFLQHWSSYKKKKDIIAFAKVLESCEPASFPKIFSSSLDADMVIAIVDAVDKYFVPEQLHQSAIEVLLAVTRVQRFDVMTMLMSIKDKTSIDCVIGKLEGDSETISQIRKRFVS